MIEREDKKMKEKIIKHIVALLITDILIVGVFIAYIFFVAQQAKHHYYYHPNYFMGSFNATKTSDGWIIRGYAYISCYNSTADCNVELSHLHYLVYNSSKGYIYEEGYVISIKNKPSPLGIVFYDVDNDNILSEEDYMFIPSKNESSVNHPHSRDVVIFAYDNCVGSADVYLP